MKIMNIFMRLTIYLICILALSSCCKDENNPPNILKNCKLAYHSTNYNVTYFNYYNGQYVGHNDNQFSLKTIKYGKDTIYLSSREISGSYSLTNYFRKSENTIEYFYKTNFPSLDSGKSSIRLANGLIISEYFVFLSTGLVDSNIYIYNSDNTIKELKSPDNLTRYEYYDIIDNINIDKNLVLLTKFFNLKTVFKLVKKKTVTSSNNTKVYEYQYTFDADKKVTSIIVNNTDTARYHYLCE